MAINRLKPKNDFIFGCLFGEKASKDSLMALLNAILRQDGSDPIIGLKVIENKQLKKDMLSDKTGRLDIRAELASGEQINVEMQMLNRYNMVKRTLFYLAKLFTASIKAGEPYEKLKKTITINLLNFELFPFERFHSTYHFYEDHEDRAMLTDALAVHFIEFPKFERAEKDKNIALHRWLLFMDEKLPEDQLKELMAMDPMIGKTEEQLEMLSGKDYVRELAEARENAMRDWNSSMSGSREEGIAIGKAEGKTEMVLKMLAKGLDVAFISEVSGMSVQQINRLAESAADSK
ncbi:Rpn family recombination-promoting nuclease/putative transposase [Cohnella silvisoli]|uniref:Rpn family recombination-promoting nuclease/putative transposase n=1 Tax=Cohnella silvisoli TaxID=2873699 RepID=A0ABV1KMN3_9BACL|nr:Rpn family recombination-promoting nuclease/putative transposase [Cohnella silvisoli]MCD9020325.1 Rpn family recombination-promoting nuclease/putative transposase [Cohnella silvisoli]